MYQAQRDKQIDLATISHWLGVRFGKPKPLLRAGRFHEVYTKSERGDAWMHVAARNILTDGPTQIGN